MYLMNPIEYKLAVTVELTRFFKGLNYYNIIFFVWIEHLLLALTIFRVAN